LSLEICIDTIFPTALWFWIIHVLDFESHVVAQLLEALRYKSGGRGFDSRWCHWKFVLTQYFRPHCGSEVDSSSTRNEYQEYFLEGKGGRCLGLTTLPSSCVHCFEIWETQPPAKISYCPGLYRPYFVQPGTYGRMPILCRLHIACTQSAVRPDSGFDVAEHTSCCEVLTQIIEWKFSHPQKLKILTFILPTHALVSHTISMLIY